MGGGDAALAAGQVEQQGVAQLDGDAGVVATPGGIDLLHVDGRQRIAERRGAAQRRLAVQRLKARRQQPGAAEGQGRAKQAAERRPMVRPPH